MAAFIVKTFGNPIEIEHALADGTVEMLTVNPTGYQCVLYATGTLYVISLLICLFLVKPTDKALEAKKAKQKAK